MEQIEVISLKWIKEYTLFMSFSIQFYINIEDNNDHNDFFIIIFRDVWVEVLYPYIRDTICAK